MTNTRGRGHVVFSGHLVEPHLLAKRGLVQNPPPHLVWPAGQPPRARVIRTPCIIAPLLYHRLELFSTAYYSALHRLSLIANSLLLYYYYLLLHIYQLMLVLFSRRTGCDPPGRRLPRSCGSRSCPRHCAPTNRQTSPLATAPEHDITKEIS